MARWFGGVLFCFIMFSILSGYMAGGDGMVVTTLASSITATQNTVPVSSVKGFLTSGEIVIDNEVMHYTGVTVLTNTFTGVTRAYETSATGGNEAIAHTSGSNVYTKDANVLANALGFDMASLVASSSNLPTFISTPLNAVAIPSAFLTITLPNLIQWNFVFLQEGLWWVAIPFLVSGASLVVMFAFAMLGVR